MNPNNWIKSIEKNGWYKFENVYKHKLIAALRNEIDSRIVYYNQIQKKASVFNESRNAFHHTILSCAQSQIQMFNPFPLHNEIKDYFSGNFILSACGATITLPNSNVYTQKIHRDSRSFLKDKYMLNAVLLLDDSDETNGSTWVLEGSHLLPDKPETEYYYKNGSRLNGKAGDLIVFDANLWHSAGENKSNKPRYVITFLLTKPFIKQSLDYTRALSKYNSKLYSDSLRQILGFNAMVPSDLEEFYQPREKRFYKSDQG